MPSLEDLVRPSEYPRSSGYDPAWVVALDMGPHPLWLLEDLAEDLELEPGMRVLDLGSGLGATSVFLAREFGVEVFAVDLWVPAADAARTFAEAGVGDRVVALHADARELPFAPGFFDAVVSVDAFEYFGTDDNYLPYLAGFVVPGGQIGIAAPALTREVRDLGGIPDHVYACVGAEGLAWHTPEWWRAHWESTRLVSVTSARLQPRGWENWLLWSRVCRDHNAASDYDIDDVIEMLEADGGRLLSFALVTARTEAAGVAAAPG
ncbi:MAG: methyltransferase domain-containing protein [Actinomycetota bacterium]|nr:methyltransferase domain-containing protein [Actinomycetota bacterium]